MELKNLAGMVFIVCIVGILVCTLVVINDNLSKSVRLSTAYTDGSVNISSGSATLSQTYCTAITNIVNATGGTDATYDPSTWNVTFTDKDACKISATLPVNRKYNISFKYGASTAAQTALDNTNTAITPVTSTWLPIIVIIAILGILLGLVLMSFGRYGMTNR